MSENKDWWRGTGEDDRIALRRHIEEAAARDPTGDRFDRLMVGTAAYTLMHGVQTRPESINALFSQIVADAELRVRQETKKMLENPDPASPEAREHHFNARVAGALIGLLNELLRLGEEAKQQINHQNEEIV